MKRASALIGAVSITAMTLLVWYPSRAAAVPSSCTTLASQALAGVGDGLSTIWEAGDHPENRHVLKSALASTAQLRACGDERDSISAELIAADAYGDVYPKRPGLRCAALRDAQQRLVAAGDVRRAHLVTTTLADCANVASDHSFGAAGGHMPTGHVASFSGPAPACSAGRALGAIADALSSTAGPGNHPEDARTLAAALKASAQLRACGNERDSISAELIAADAYSDVYPNNPGKQCTALRDARSRLRAIGDVKRADLVRRTLATGSTCRSA